MATRSIRGIWVFTAGLLVVCILLAGPIDHLFFSVRLVRSIQELASGATGRDLAVKETTMRRRMGDRDCEALIYCPAKSRPTSAVVVAAGISELGCHHPSLVAFSRFLAGSGFLVITPDIVSLRNFQISTEPIDQILFWHSQVATMEGSEKIQKIGLGGISFSGTLALLAAARPEVCDRIGFVVGIGSYYSLARCAKEWFAASPAAAGSDYYPTRFYAKWIVMLSALDMLAALKDRSFLREVLNSLLLQRKIPPADSDLTPEGLRWYDLATMREDQSDPELARKIEEYLVARIDRGLDPQNALGRVRCPVFLIHGAYDDLIPPEESVELHRRIAHSYLLVSPFLTHTHATGTPLSLSQKAKAGFDALSFCFQFSRAAR